MAINYALSPNHLTLDPNDQKARVEPIQVYSLDDLIGSLKKRGTTLTEVDLRAVLNLFFDEVTDLVANGNSVNMPLVNIRPSISGIFKDVNDVFDAKRHSIGASVSAGVLLKDKLSKASVTKLAGSSIASPDIVSFTDSTTHTSNLATKGSLGEITGSDLKYNAENALEGIFFINKTTKAETKVKDLATLSANKLVFIIPASLATGDYYLQVRKAYTKDNTIRFDQLESSLKVG
jgi:hypothetical protein